MSIYFKEVDTVAHLFGRPNCEVRIKATVMPAHPKKVRGVFIPQVRLSLGRDDRHPVLAPVAVVGSCIHNGTPYRW